jgi:hypothetical protein
VFTNSIHVSQETYWVTVKKVDWLWLFREMITVFVRYRQCFCWSAATYYFCYFHHSHLDLTHATGCKLPRLRPLALLGGEGEIYRSLPFYTPPCQLLGPANLLFIVYRGCFPAVKATCFQPPDDCRFTLNYLCFVHHRGRSHITQILFASLCVREKTFPTLRDDDHIILQGAEPKYTDFICKH